MGRVGHALTRHGLAFKAQLLTNQLAMEACLGPRSEAEDGEDGGHNGTKPEEWSRV